MTDLRPITTPDAPTPGGAYSQALRAGDLIAVAGQVGRDPRTGELPASFEEQVAQAIRNLIAVLAATGLGLDAVVKTTCFLADIDDFAIFDRIYQEAFREPYPARSTFGVALAGELGFEIEAWAYAG